MAVEGEVLTNMAQPLFRDVVCTIIRSKTLPEDEVEKLARVLKANGAEYWSYESEPGRIANVSNYTHIISSTSDFPDYYAAVDRYVHVVKPSWVDICVQKGKLANPRQYDPNPAFFLSDVCVTCADIPEGDKEAIVGGVLAMGGQYSAPLTKFVTHIVALTMDNEKCDVALRKGLQCKVVLPHWFDDCLKLRRKIAEGPYMLPNPDILSTNSGPPKPHDNADLLGASSPTVPRLLSPMSLPEGPNDRLTVFSDKGVMLSDDLELGSRLRTTIEGIIRERGGTIVHKVAHADIYVCHYRDGQDYVHASQREDTDVGNLAWLYYLITHDTWTSPMRRLLHYPLPRNGIPGFEKWKICLSNYTGEARVFLENLVLATGAEYTKTMKQDNTHLITAHTMSEKCEAAKEWNINIINHLWLEESYAECKMQTLTNPRYTHFPPRTNLGEVVGQTPVNRRAIEKFFLNKASKPGEPIGKVKDAEQPGPNLTINAPPSTTVPASSIAGSKDAAAEHKPSPLAHKAKRVQSDGALRTPAPSRFAEGKENETPSTNSSRGAKERALSKLHDLAPDMALYEKELKRVGGVIYGGRKVSDPDRINFREKEMQPRKRSHEDFSKNDDSSDEGGADTMEEKGTRGRPKKAKTARPQISHRLMLSGDNRWLNKTKKESEDKVKLRNLGILLTQNPAEVTLLCAPKIIRTKKFAAAIAAAPVIVHSSFLDHCLEHEEIPPVSEHLLLDKESEKTYGFRLVESLERAKQNRGMLLKGWEIFCTEKVKGGFDSFREIIAANGGTCNLYKGRTGLTVKKRAVDMDESSNDEREANRARDDGDTLYLISSNDPEEMALWDKFRRLAQEHDMVPRIVKPDWLLFVAMAQFVDWDQRWQASETAD